MEEQIRTQMMKAFWDLLDEDMKEEPPRLNHVSVLLNEIIGILKSFVPRRIDIHESIDKDFEGDITWEMQGKLIKWIECFQAPIYDHKTRIYNQKGPQPLSDFLKWYYDHLNTVKNDISRQRREMASGVMRTGV
jgi:hypothetical protein